MRAKRLHRPALALAPLLAVALFSPPGRPESPRPESGGAESARSESPRPESGGAESARSESSRPESPRPELLGAESTRSEVTHPESLRSESPSPEALGLPANPGSAPRPFVVMLDPGHGGSNTGAAGVVEGLYEKRLTLALARAVAARLARAPGVVVKLTRTDDRYLTLRERVRLANRRGADVFVSLHANASPSRGQRGFETFVLSPEALEIDARAMRGGDGPERPGVDEATAAILDDLERAAAHPWAVRLAERIQARLAAVRGPEGNRGVKQAAMDVLMGPTMPAVLVEVGFLDHPVEGVELLRRQVRDRIADAIAAAILEWRHLRAADPL